VLGNSGHHFDISLTMMHDVRLIMR